MSTSRDAPERLDFWSVFIALLVAGSVGAVSVALFESPFASSLTLSSRSLLLAIVSAAGGAIVLPPLLARLASLSISLPLAFIVLCVGKLCSLLAGYVLIDVLFGVARRENGDAAGWLGAGFASSLAVWTIGAIASYHVLRWRLLGSSARPATTATAASATFARPREQGTGARSLRRQLPPHHDARRMGGGVRLLLFVLCVVVFPVLGFWASTWLGHLYDETPTVLVCWVVIPASLSFVCASLARRPILGRLAWAIASGLTAPVAFAVLLGVLSRGDTS